MHKIVKTIIVSASLRAVDKRFASAVVWLFVVAVAILYFVVDREKLVMYVISFAINQVLLFLLFGAGVVALINIYVARKLPSIFDEILIKNNTRYFREMAYIFQVFKQWETSLYLKPIGFNSIGKELIIRDFILSEIRYIEYNLVVVFEDILTEIDSGAYGTSEKICDKFREIFITKRLQFSDRFGESLVNKISVIPNANLPMGRRKEILRVVPQIILQKYINSCADFNIFLDNCIAQINRENYNRYNTLLALYSDMVKAIYAYKDNILPNFKEEFNGDLAQYNLLYNDVPLSGDTDYEKTKRKY